MTNPKKHFNTLMARIAEANTAYHTKDTRVMQPPRECAHKHAAGIHDFVGKHKKPPVFVSTLILALLTLFSASAQASSTIPFVGCPTDSGDGPITPIGQPTDLNVPSKIASKLAVYAGNQMVILAPRGWSCSGTDSDGSLSLSVYPLGSRPDTTGPVVNETLLFGGTSNNTRATISFGGRYFPKLVSESAVRNFMSEDTIAQNETEDQFLAPRYPSDVLTYISNAELEFDTPAGKTGLGATTPTNLTTYGFMKASFNQNEPDNDSILFFTVRLPKNSSSLKQTIVDFSGCFSKLMNNACSLKAIYGQDSSQ